MKRIIKNYFLIIVFTLSGGFGGFLYWKLVGCLLGTCIIKSVWYWSTLYGLVLGYATGGLTEEIILKIKSRKNV